VHLVVFFTVNKSYKLEGLVGIGYISWHAKTAPKEAVFDLIAVIN